MVQGMPMLRGIPMVQGMSMIQLQPTVAQGTSLQPSAPAASPQAMPKRPYKRTVEATLARSVDSLKRVQRDIANTGAGCTAHRLRLLQKNSG